MHFRSVRGIAWGESESEIVPIADFELTVVHLGSLAYAEMRLIAAKMLWSFDMTLDESSASWNIQKTYLIWERKPLMLKLSQAQHRER